MTISIRAEYENSHELVEAAAKDLALYIENCLSQRDDCHLVITGGTVGISVLAALVPWLTPIGLNGLHIWWGDERFVSKFSPDRNDLQASEALLSKISIPAQNIHPFPSNEDGGIEAAGLAFQEEIEEASPEFDIVLLGMGHDGHVASLFPGKNGKAFGKWVVVEQNSPKPPKERMSLSYQAINSSQEVWFLVSGAEKAEAVAAVFAGKDLPASKVQGKKTTKWYLDKPAGSLISS